MNINLDEATFIKLLKKNAEQYGDRKAALRQKARGIWQPYSWKQYYDSVKYFSLGLSSRGLVKGDKVAIIGSNRPASLFAEIGAQAAGGIPICLFPDATQLEVVDTLNRFDARFVIAEDQEQVDKILEASEKPAGLDLIIYSDPRGMRKYPKESLISFEELSACGREYEEKHPDFFERQSSSAGGDDIAMICTTSGASGPPLGAMLTFRNLLSMAEGLNQSDTRRESDEYLSFLPLAWFGEQFNALACALSSGYTVNFPERPETTMADLREIGPHILFSPPAVWESMAAMVQVKIMDTTPFKRLMYKTFMSVGKQVATLKLAKKPIPFSLRILNIFAYICLFRALRDRLGLSRVRSAASGGSPISEEVLRFFHACGVNLRQFYGLTEIAGVSCIHRDGDIRGDTVGIPLPNTEIKIDSNGEVLFRSSSIFRGYYKDEVATTRVLKDGWLHSGDIGHMETDGHLIVLGRINELITLTDGARLSASFIEGKLKFSPFIKEAIVFTGKNSAPAALIAIDGRVVSKWAGDNKLNYSTYSDLASKQEIYGLIEQELSKVNGELQATAKLGSFALIYKELDPDDEELTRTGKVKRGVIMERFAPIIEAVRASRECVEIDTVINLQDGKSANIRTTVAIRELNR